MLHCAAESLSFTFWLLLTDSVGSAAFCVDRLVLNSPLSRAPLTFGSDGDRNSRAPSVCDPLATFAFRTPLLLKRLVTGLRSSHTFSLLRSDGFFFVVAMRSSSMVTVTNSTLSTNADQNAQKLPLLAQVMRLHLPRSHCMH